MSVQFSHLCDYQAQTLDSLFSYSLAPASLLVHLLLSRGSRSLVLKVLLFFFFLRVSLCCWVFQTRGAQIFSKVKLVQLKIKNFVMHPPTVCILTS